MARAVEFHASKTRALVGLLIGVVLFVVVGWMLYHIEDPAGLKHGWFGYISLWLGFLFCPDVIYASAQQINDDAPNLVVNDEGFTYSVGSHRIGRFRWSDVTDAGFRRIRYNRFLVVTIADRSLITPRPLLVTRLIRVLGLGALIPRRRSGPGNILIANGAVGGRLDEVEALFRRHLAARQA